MACVGAPRFDSYDWRGGREAMLRYGPDRGPVVLALPPLFEEANRTRTFLTGLLRRLAAAGIGAVLPDLPGTGESLVATERMRLADLRAAGCDLAGRLAADGPVHLLAIRSGALLADVVPSASRWLFSPQDGPSLLRELRRVALVDEQENRNDRAYLAGDPTTGTQLIAGNAIAPAFLAELAGNGTATAAPSRTVRLGGDPRPADRYVPGAQLWRRSEPGDDPALAALLADDLAAWIAACAG